MARSKSKSRPTQNAIATSSQGQALPTKGVSAGPAITRRPAGESAATCLTQNHSPNLESSATGDAAVGLLEQVSNQVESSGSTSSPTAEVAPAETGNDDFEFQLKHQEIEAALERVDLWLADNSSETENPEQREQPLAQGVATHEVSETQPGQSNQLILVASEQQRQFQGIPGSQGMDANSACQRLEASAAAIESRLEKLWTGFEANLNRRFANLLQAFDRMPQRLAEIQVDPKAKAREAYSAPVPAEATWETRKRQMLSEFGMTPDEIEQLVPNQKQAKAANEKSNLPPNIESIALEALHSSLETLDKIDSGIRSEEIDRLKEQLTAQLREAEVELSINRAKLCKEWAALEQRATEVSQRESALKSKYIGAGSSAKHGLLDRLTRHLSRRS